MRNEEGVARPSSSLALLETDGGTVSLGQRAIRYERDRRGRAEFEAPIAQDELVRRAARGDQEAFAVLAAEAFPRVTGVAQLILRDPELARDAVQETLIRAWRDLRSLRDPSRFDAWLHRAAVRTCLNVARRRRHRPIEARALADSDAPGVPDDSTRIADREVVDAALRRLTPEGRAVIVLHFYLGLSLPETAAALGVPVGTVKSRLHLVARDDASCDRRSMTGRATPRSPEGRSHDASRTLRA